MKNILKYNKKNKMAHRYMKTNYIDISQKDSKSEYKYETHYNVTSELPKENDES